MFTGTFNYKQLGKTDEGMKDKIANAMQNEVAYMKPTKSNANL